MDILEIVLRSVFSVAALFIVTKLMGYRQISQLSFYDYIIGISIGNLSANMAMDLETDLWQTLIPLLIYGAMSIFVSFLTMKSIKLRRVMAGTPIVLIENGELLEDNLKKAKFDVNEFLGECRAQGYFNLADLKYAIMEHTGKISFLPYEDKRPCTPGDLNLSPQQEGMVANLIIDGKIMHRHLKAVGKEEKWLEKQIAQSKAKKREDILLATYDINGTFSVFLKNEGISGTHILV